MQIVMNELKKPPEVKKAWRQCVYIDVENHHFWIILIL